MDNEMILVKCIYFNGSKDNGCNYIRYKSFNCKDKFGHVDCRRPFYIDWIKYLLYREYVIKVNNDKPIS